LPICQFVRASTVKRAALNATCLTTAIALYALGLRGGSALCLLAGGLAELVFWVRLTRGWRAPGPR
jgi:ACR3 family arsenite efflux pump ArsB